MKIGILYRGMEMKALVIKEIKVLRFINLFILAWGLAAGLSGTMVEGIFMSKVIYGYGIFFMVFIYSMMSTQYSMKNRTDIVINSLPITRYDVVRAKYITVILYMLFGALVVFISSNIAVRIFPNSLTNSNAILQNMLLNIGLSLIFFSVYLVFQFYNIDKIQIFNAIFYMLFILAPNLLKRFIPNIVDAKWINKLSSMNLNKISLILVGIGIILYLISMEISKQIYKWKEF